MRERLNRAAIATRSLAQARGARKPAGGRGGARRRCANKLRQAFGAAAPPCPGPRCRANLDIS
ncbi:hypothetical protein LEN_3452 [Lysobacter enzymogenes]|uniref:Uncharacterized protein n=1 Tax=Lysobacter enzymogenes TaxID=69 RepID=A0AAU9AK75_LYSEN|nr:hypothetical protein LEN_3452 [Lysobacter enzymogenes]